MRLLTTSLTLFLLHGSPSAQAFAPSHQVELFKHHSLPQNTRTTSSSSALSYSFRNNDEKARINALENLFNDHEDLENGLLQDPERTLLTSTSRRSRELEIALLDTLTESDDAIDELVHLWVYQKNQDLGQRLEAMQSQCSPGLVEEIRDLNHMIGEHPEWAEPWSRIACVYFVKGHIGKAFHACKEALHRKPWHPEVYQLLVRLSLRQGDRRQAIHWARQGLPLKPNSKRRQRWVQGAKEDAQQRLELDEEYTTKISVAKKVRMDSHMQTQGILDSTCEDDEDFDIDSYNPDDGEDECELGWE